MNLIIKIKNSEDKLEISDIGKKTVAEYEKWYINLNSSQPFLSLEIEDKKYTIERSEIAYYVVEG